MIVDDLGKEWHTVSTHPNYRLSTDGELVQNARTGKVLKQCDNNRGYGTVNLYNHGEKTTISVHRLVAEQMLECANTELTVDHKNGNKHDNHPDNLEWVTYSENELRAHKLGLKHGPKRKPVMVIESGEIFPSIKECARAIGGNDSHIGSCLRGKYSSHHGLTFRYVDVDPDSVETTDGAQSRACSKYEPYRKPVRVVETGVVYPSVQECARSIGGDQPIITACLKGRHKTHHGYHYEWAD